MKRYALNEAKVPNLPGVRVEDNTVVIEGYKDKHIDLIREKTKVGDSDRKNVLADFQKEYSPSEIERTLIKEKVGERIDSFHFVETIAADTLIDRTYDKFTKAFLERMATKYIEGRTIVDSHNTKIRIGRTFAAEVIPHPEKVGESQLIVKFYLSPNTPAGKQAINEVKDGIVDRVSVSFRPDYEAVTFIDEDDENSPEPGKVFWSIDAGDPELEEVIELSLVAMGAQPGAKFKSENGRVQENPTFDIKEITPRMETIELTYKLGDVEKGINVPKENADAFKALIKGIEDAQAETAKAVKTQKELEKRIGTYEEKEKEVKTAMVVKLVNLKKSVFGEDSVDAEQETTICESLPVEFLEKEIDRMEKTVKARKGLKPDGKPREEGDENEKESYGTVLDSI